MEVASESIGYVGSHDGSVSGFSMIGHLITGDKAGNVQSNIITAKNKIGKRTVVMHELLSLVLATADSCAVIRLLPAEALITITRVVFPKELNI